MQFFEILLSAILIFQFLIRLFFKKTIKNKYLTGILVIALMLHILIEGYRWQMIPIYIVWVIVLIILNSAPQNKPKTFLKIFKNFGILLLFLIGILFSTILPVFELPKPTGSYSVGTKDILMELNRDEVITADNNDKRKLMVKVWYPSNDEVGIKDKYIDAGGRHGFAKKYNLPSSTFNYLDKINTYVFRDATIAEEQFPVLIFSHGYHSKANNYYALLTEIASHGYVVFAVNHTYESTGSTFPDGTEVYFDQNYAQKIEEGTWEDMKPVIAAFHENLSFQDRHLIVRKGLKNYFVRGMVERWSEDLKDVVSNMDYWNSIGFFKEKLDLSNIGVFGHSRGGGAAGETLLTDKRIKAGVNIDGVQWGRIVDTSFSQPFLFISADWPEEKEDLNAHAYVNKSESDFYEARIFNTGHSSFMDIPFMIPVETISQAGDIDPNLGIEITSKLIISFFDSYLKNKAVDFNLLDSEYEQLNLKIHPGEQ
jgi:predicted dienelactone hydrolase